MLECVAGRRLDTSRADPRCYTQNGLRKDAHDRSVGTVPRVFFQQRRRRSRLMSTSSASDPLAKFWLKPVALATVFGFRATELRHWNGSWKKISNRGWRPGMSSLVVQTRPRASEVTISDHELMVLLVDGRKVSVPLTWFPRLRHTKPSERQNFELLGEGEGIHWPDVDEDPSVAGLLVGTLCRR